MEHKDQQAIGDLFEKLNNVARQYPDRDGDAERLIGQKVAEQPAAPYYMAQTIVVQDQALADANARITALEHQIATSVPQQGGGFLSGLFGGGRQAVPAPQPRPAAAPNPMPHPAAQQQGQSARGGFLAGAAQTAVGVAGGMMLGNAVASMFGSDEAVAAEPTPEPAAEPAPVEESGDDEGGFFDMEW